LRTILVPLLLASLGTVLLWQLGLGSGSTLEVDVEAYEMLTKEDGYEIRRYQASTAVATIAATHEGEDDGAFMRLAGFIGAMGEAKNSRHQKFAMTAPIVTVADEDGLELQFILPPQVNGSAPEPTQDGVHLVTRPSSMFAVQTFLGAWPTSEFVKRAKALAAKLEADGYKVDYHGNTWQHLRYNPPWTSASFRNNEVAVKIQDVRTF